MTMRCYVKPLLAVLVDPFSLEPRPRVGIVWRYKMKLFGVNAFGMPKWAHVRSKQKIERFNLLGIGFPRVYSFKAFHQKRTAYRSPSNRGKVCKVQLFLPSDRKLCALSFPKLPQSSFGRKLPRRSGLSNDLNRASTTGLSCYSFVPSTELVPHSCPCGIV